MSLRVLGIDPGLTRCGVGIVDVAPNRTATLVHVTVLRTTPDQPLAERLLSIGTGIETLMDEHQPVVVAIERVFAQHNLRTVMGVAQISGVALHAAAKRGLDVSLHTPSEVKAAITGYGSADKRQVQAMVARILGLAEVPRPADAADALALAICHAWRTPISASSQARSSRIPTSANSRARLTPAQEAWRAAEKGTTSSVPPRRLSR